MFGMIVQIAAKATNTMHLSISDKLDAKTKSAPAIGVDLINVGLAKSNVISHPPQNQNRH